MPPCDGTWQYSSGTCLTTSIESCTCQGNLMVRFNQYSAQFRHIREWLKRSNTVSCRHGRDGHQDKKDPVSSFMASTRASHPWYVHKRSLTAGRCRIRLVLRTGTNSCPPPLRIDHGSMDIRHRRNSSLRATGELSPSRCGPSNGIVERRRKILRRAQVSIDKSLALLIFPAIRHQQIIWRGW